MDMTKIDEQWLDLPKIKKLKNSIVAISNTGKYRRSDGTIGILRLRQSAKCCGKREHCSKIIAEHFLITVKRPDQEEIDHITHYPTEYAMNDVRNLRWCTQAENVNFEEARDSKSKSVRRGIKHPMYGITGEKHPMYGKGYLISWDKHPAWKGDDVGPSGAYRRAQKLYKEGKITEEELKRCRVKLQEHRRNKRAKRATS